jgi:hypothetical protein
MKESQLMDDLRGTLLKAAERALKRGQQTWEFRSDMTAFELTMVIASLAFFPSRTSTRSLQSLAPTSPIRPRSRKDGK